MSYFDTNIQNNRTVSIYGNQKEFPNPNAELNFSKDYNKKMYFPEKEYRGYKPESTFNDKNHQEILKENLRTNNQNKLNSANYRKENPITYEGKQEQQQKFIHKSTAYSNVDNIRDNTIDMDSKWKPSSKRIDVKPSANFEETQKKQHKTPQYNFFENRNPLLGGSEPQKAARVTSGATGDQKISNDYKKMKDRQALLPSQMKAEFQQENPSIKQNYQSESYKIGQNHQGSQAKNLIACEYPQGHNYKQLTQKENSFKPDQRTYDYNQNNLGDHRKHKTQFFYYNKNPKN